MWKDCYLITLKLRPPPLEICRRESSIFNQQESRHANKGSAIGPEVLENASEIGSWLVSTLATFKKMRIGKCVVWTAL
jgi:hypothetical protein